MSRVERSCRAVWVGSAEVLLGRVVMVVIRAFCVAVGRCVGEAVRKECGRGMLGEEDGEVVAAGAIGRMDCCGFVCFD